MRMRYETVSCMASQTLNLVESHSYDTGEGSKNPAQATASQTVLNDASDPNKMLFEWKIAATTGGDDSGR